MVDEQHDRSPDDAPPIAYCTTKPLPGSYLTLASLTAPCVDCAHATAVHIGVEHCPVCELVGHNANARAAAEAVTVAPMSLADQAWADVQARHAAANPDGP
jgi:hypothetical protein